MSFLPDCREGHVNVRLRGIEDRDRASRKRAASTLQRHLVGGASGGSPATLLGGVSPGRAFLLDFPAGLCVGVKVDQGRNRLGKARGVTRRL